MFLLIILRQLGLGQWWENCFLVLGEEVAKPFNFSNCWVCRGPGGSEEWPWVASPVEPKWWVNTLSEVYNGTGFWDEEGSPWQLHCSGRGIYCLNRTAGVYMGKGVCDWTLSLGLDCWTPNCPPDGCSTYRGSWSQTHDSMCLSQQTRVKLRNGVSSVTG